MSKNFQKGGPLKPGPGHDIFEVKRTVRLGTAKAPAKISVQTEERKQELVTVFAEKGWSSIITVDPDQDENIRDLEALQNKPVSVVGTKKANRNDPCPCGSGKKYKKCCAV